VDVASRHYIKFDGVEGESTAQDHKGEIEVLSWAWGLSAGPAGAGGRASVGRPKAGDFTFTHVYDKASPLLARAVATGKAIKHVLMSSRKPGSGQKDFLKDFLKVSMKEVVVMSVQQVADEATGITETVTLSSRTVSFEYRPATATGSLGDPVMFDWDGVKSK
jgi:type VI secretion system secreted protein Hcp